MPRRLLSRLIAIGLMLSFAAVPASSRPWKPDAKAAANDYAQIIHNKPGGGVVIVWWLVPQVVPTVPQAQDFLDKYVIIGVVEARVAPTGTMSFAPIDTLVANDSNGNALKHMTPNDVPPALTGLLAALQAGLAQSLGAMGQGIRWFVFDGAGVHSCGNGGLAVPLDGETYTYETPIPGCPKI